MSDPMSEPGGDGPRGIGHLNLGRAVAVTVLFVIVAVYLLHSGTQPTRSTASSASTTITEHKATTTTTTIARSQVKVQVANGSTTAGVATRVTQSLQTLGWDTLPPTNSTSQVPASVVYYAANRKPQALEIASELKLAATAVQPLTTSVPVPGAAGDDVVVVAGPDLAQG